MKNKTTNRRLKYGTLATVMTIGFLAALVLVNVVATLLLDRFPLSIDLTAEKRFQLTQDSVDMLGELQRDVKITVLAKEADYNSSSNEYYKQAYEVIKNYSRYSDRVTVSFVDILENPTFAQGYPELSLTTSDILVESDLRAKKLATSDLFEVTQTQYAGVQYSSKAEQALTGAVLYVTDDSPSRVLLLSQQSSIDMSAYQSLLEANNYSVETRSLLTEELDADASLLLLPQPDADLTAEQVKKLSDFLDNDGKFGRGLIFVASSNLEIGPVLKNFLAEWGVEIDSGMIYETNASYAVQNNFITINEIADSEVSGQVTGIQPVVVPFSHPVKPLFDERDNRSTRVILQTQPTSIYVPADFGEDFDVEAQEQSTYSTMVLGTRAKYVDNEKVSSYVLAAGSDNMFSASFLERGDMGNGALVAAATNTIAEKKDAIRILPVDLNNQAITITSGQITIFLIVLVGVIPLLLLGAALAVFLYRRHL